MPKVANLDYKERADWWRKAAERNLDMLAEAYEEISKLRLHIAALEMHKPPTVQPERPISGGA